MERSFEVLIRQGDSVMAANAIARTLSERSKLLSAGDTETFIGFVVGGDSRAKAIAVAGLDLIRSKQGCPLAEISDENAEQYIRWLSDFALKRAAHGRVFTDDRGKTLLVELRKVATTTAD